MTYTYPAYVIWIAIALAVVSAISCGVLAWRKSPIVYALVAFAISVLLGPIMAPTLALDRVVLDDQKLEQTTGFWFSPTAKGFRHFVVDSISIESRRGSKGRLYEVWVVKKKNGQVEEIDPGDLWEMNGDDIIRRLREKGIRVSR